MVFEKVCMEYGWLGTVKNRENGARLKLGDLGIGYIVQMRSVGPKNFVPASKEPRSQRRRAGFQHTKRGHFVQ